MKTKTIKTVLRKKIDDWLSSIEDEALRDHVKSHCLVTGGAIASMLLGEPPNDFDVYFTDKDTCARVARYYVAKYEANAVNSHKTGGAIDIKVDTTGDRVKVRIQSAGIASEEGTASYHYFESTGINDPSCETFVADVAKVLDEEQDKSKPRYRPIFMSSNAITLSGKIQIVLRFFGEVAEIHKNYDFVHCTCAWESKTGELILPPKALEALLAKELVYVGSKYPICSVIRTRKFIARGFSINAGQFMKMAFQISELDLSDIDVLEDQLTGVDSAYFDILIKALRAKKEKDPEFKANYLYVLEIIDRIF
ncbi:MAG: hypothetical protein WC911_01635 [Thermoleophilia bacterium]